MRRQVTNDLGLQLSACMAPKGEGMQALRMDFAGDSQAGSLWLKHEGKVTPSQRSCSGDMGEPPHVPEHSTPLLTIAHSSAQVPAQKKGAQISK